MKKWKIINKISIVIILIFVILVIYNLISCYNYKGKYPYPALGIDINNWYEQFCLNMYFIWYICAIPLLVAIVLLIVSIIKLRRCR